MKRSEGRRGPWCDGVEAGKQGAMARKLVNIRASRARVAIAMQLIGTELIKDKEDYVRFLRLCTQRQPLRDAEQDRYEDAGMFQSKS